MMTDNELKADLEALVEQWRKITESRPTEIMNVAIIVPQMHAPTNSKRC